MLFLVLLFCDFSGCLGLQVAGFQAGVSVFASRVSAFRLGCSLFLFFLKLFGRFGFRVLGLRTEGVKIFGFGIFGAFKFQSGFWASVSVFGCV